MENDIQKLIDIGLSYIPKESVIAGMIADLRAWYAVEKDWRATREKLKQTMGMTNMAATAIWCRTTV